LEIERRKLAAEQARLRRESEALRAERCKLEEERRNFHSATLGKSPVRLSASLHDLSVAVNEEGAVAPPNNRPDYDQYSPSGASTMGRRSAFANGGVKSHAALCKSVSQVSSTDSTRTEEEDDTTTVSSSSGGSSGSLSTALQTEIRRRAAEKSAPGTFVYMFQPFSSSVLVFELCFCHHGIVRDSEHIIRKCFVGKE
jgi:hypothetical protein